MGGDTHELAQSKQVGVLRVYEYYGNNCNVFHAGTGQHVTVLSWVDDQMQGKGNFSCRV